ncbi:cell adhesion protein [Clostridium sporogenes]|uniref:cell adhesion protein n=1 Tax=Clostridium sporogenes TaxID=1509 RepID=UPI00214A7EAD|nr:cell adhesion protein [Clostridium sporogenes]MCR1972854.1 cell adhesion protein [Clostridium sporogenes]MCW6078249.1 cell adhesion protein [Clostridium sporogenes]
MAKIGEQLLQPENGWKRFDDSDENISYIGNGWLTEYNSHYSNTVGNKICFNFIGSKIRILVFTNNSHSKDVKIKISNTVYSYVEYIEPIKPASLVLIFEKEMPSFKEYSVEIYIERKTDSQYGWFGLDSIDIGENGKLKCYNPDLYKYLIQDKHNILYTLNDNNLVQVLSQTIDENNFNNNGFSDIYLITKDLLLNKFESLEGIKLLAYTDDLEKNKCEMTYNCEPFRPIDKFKKNSDICNILFKEI